MSDAVELHGFWVDDEVADLPVLVEILRLHRINVTCLRTYEEAKARVIERREKDLPMDFVLLDVIIPRHEAGGTLGTEVGVALARVASDYDVPRVVFLTVRGTNTVQALLLSLRERFPTQGFAVHDKLRLCEPGAISQLVQSIRGGQDV